MGLKFLALGDFLHECEVDFFACSRSFRETLKQEMRGKSSVAQNKALPVCFYMRFVESYVGSVTVTAAGVRFGAERK